MELTITRTNPPDRDAPVRMHVHGSIDIATREALLDAAVTAFLVSPTLQLDANGVESIDAAGIEVLHEIAAIAENEGATFELTGRSPELQRALDRVGLGTAWRSARL